MDGIENTKIDMKEFRDTEVSNSLLAEHQTTKTYKSLRQITSIDMMNDENTLVTYKVWVNDASKFESRSLPEAIEEYNKY